MLLIFEPNELFGHGKLLLQIFWLDFVSCYVSDYFSQLLNFSMDKIITILITGSSKGLGYDLVRIFLQKNPQTIIYATSRDGPQKASERWKGLDKKNVIKCREL